MFKALLDLLNPWSWRADRRGERELEMNEERFHTDRAAKVAAGYEKGVPPRVLQSSVSSSFTKKRTPLRSGTDAVLMLGGVGAANAMGRFPLRRLHATHRAWRLSSVVWPPSENGMTWSPSMRSLGMSRRQSAHRRS